MLSSSRRSELRAQAHKLKPVVLIGDKGLTENVLAEVDRALKAHELIKVKAASDNRELRSGWLANICATLGAEPVQEIGKILVVYRANPEEDKPKPKAPPKPKTRSRPKAKPTPTGTSRRQSRTPSPRPESAPRRRRPRTSR